MLHWLESFGVNTKVILAVFGIGMMATVFILLDVRIPKAFGYALTTAPVWLPVITFFLFFEYWMYYVQREYVLNYGRTTLEIKLPQEIFKSPEAMELVMIQLYQKATPDNHKETYIDGKHPPTTSLELVSRGGEVKFYLNIPKKRYKEMWEAQLYAHYPGIEVRELDVDYTAEIPWNPKKWFIFSFHMGLKKPDAYPIKTYIDFGMDRLPKEEEKIDPINTMLEALASIQPHEQIWIQILIKGNKAYGFKEGSLFGSPDWKDAARKEIRNIIDKAAKRVGVSEEDTGKNLNQFLSDAERDTIKAIERTLGKFAFDTLIRWMYITPADKVRIGDIAPRFLTAWFTYEDANRNGIGAKWRTDYDWPWWQDPSGHRRLHLKQGELDEYKRRVIYNKGHNYGMSVMTTEELATIYHFPGKVSTTPSLARLPSKRAEAPANLPTGPL